MAHQEGGGPPKDPKEDPNIDKVISLIKSNVEGFFNIYDSDYTLLDNNEYHDENVPSPSLPVVDLDNHSSYKNSCKKESAAEVPINGDWTNYTPALLRTPRAKVLVETVDYEILREIESEVEVETIVHVKEGLDKNSGSSPPPVTPNSENEYKTKTIENKTPLKSAIKSTKHLTNRRRPILKESEAVALATTKIETLKSTVEQSKQQHEVVMRCLLLQEQQEKEKLKQEQEKTEQEIIRKKILSAELENILNKSPPNKF